MISQESVAATIGFLTMPPDSHSSHCAFDIGMLDPRVLDTPDELYAALRAIEGVCHRSGPEIARIVSALISRPYILEYIISGTLHALVVGYRALPVPIISFSSGGRTCVRETLGVGAFGVPHTYNSQHDGYYEYEASPETFRFAVVRGVPVLSRYSLRPPHILDKGGTLIRCPKGAGGAFQRRSYQREHISSQP